MPTEREVRDLVERLKRQGDVVSHAATAVLLREAAETLEKLLPGFYGFVDEEGLGVSMLENAVPESGMVAQVLPQTTWDACWAARRGQAVECFPTREQANAWVQEGRDAV